MTEQLPSRYGLWAVVVSDLPDCPAAWVKPIVYIDTQGLGNVAPYIVWRGELHPTSVLHNPGGGRHLTLFDHRPGPFDIDRCLTTALSVYVGETRADVDPPSVRLEGDGE